MKTVRLTVELTNVPDNFDEVAFIENAATSGEKKLIGTHHPIFVEHKNKKV